MKIQFEECIGDKVRRHCIPVEELADVDTKGSDSVYVTLKNGDEYIASGTIKFIS